MLYKEVRDTYIHTYGSYSSFFIIIPPKLIILLLLYYRCIIYLLTPKKYFLHGVTVYINIMHIYVCFIVCACK